VVVAYIRAQRSVSSRADELDHDGLNQLAGRLVRSLEIRLQVVAELHQVLDLGDDPFLHIQGGQRATRATSVCSDDYNPAWSPNSYDLVGSNGGEIYVTSDSPIGPYARNLTNDPGSDIMPNWK